MSLKPQQRRARIADMVAAQGQVTVEALAAQFQASSETIRRDLTLLDEAGEVRKIHGGARRAPPQEEGPFHERMEQNRAAKRLIADKLARRVAPGQTLFMDTGTTTLICAQALKGVRLITNSTRIAAASAGEVFLIGGRYEPDNAETLGPTAIEEINRFSADSAVITVGALCAEQGAADFNFDEAQIARAMIARSRRLLVVADASKFEGRASFVVCPLNKIDLLITDRAPGEELSAALAAAAVEVA